jgi:serine protease AprX
MSDGETPEREGGGSTPREPRRRRTGANPDEAGFLPESLDRSVIAIPLLDRLDEEVDRWRAAGGNETTPVGEPERYDVIIDLHLGHVGGRHGAAAHVRGYFDELRERGHFAEILEEKSRLVEQYLFAQIEGRAIRDLAVLDDRWARGPIDNTAGGSEQKTRGEPAKKETRTRAIYRIWPDFEVRATLTKSVSTVKADAARSAFAASGEDIVWAVIDSGIAGGHRHFVRHRNLELAPPLEHMDFTLPRSTEETSLTDDAGHGTHVAGIIAGEAVSEFRPGSNVPDDRLVAVMRHWDEKGGITYSAERLSAISGIAPRAKIVSFKVLDKNGRGLTSNIIAALAKIQELNGFGRRLLIHGVNLSVGYDFQPEWFACGQSPICVEVDRLVRSGVIVVVSSGNTGYGFQTSKFEGTVAAGMSLSINDPGNAALAITVGSTHRDAPHTYGVSYFSSKGPTGDGRLKPDVVAPGEKIVSCAAGKFAAKAETDLQANQNAPAMKAEYIEQSGTSMAAPHVSGVIAAFLSVRREFIGRSEAVKEIFMNTATDLKRDRYFQGSGLIDLMRAIQSV